ncbi:MAG: AAA family ATPase [Anaerolineales bacterium]|nr:AAA family ATPase [Anaerolineales bacterium]
MTITIALAGKGGVGKTTVAGMIIKYLALNQTGSILAIDADPSANLNMVLGLELEWTVGDIREDMLEQVKTSLNTGGAAMGTMPGGISKRDYLEYHIRASLSEGQRFDLIAMGRGEGPGCYCAVNHNLREVVDSLSRHYAYVVIDNEAGLEHLSRRTTRDVQHLIIVSDPTRRGLVAAQRVVALSNSLDVKVEQLHLVVNRAPQGVVPEPLQAEVDKVGAPLLGVVPGDNDLMNFEFTGKPLIDLGDKSPVYQAVVGMMDKILHSSPAR